MTYRTYWIRTLTSASNVQYVIPDTRVSLRTLLPLVCLLAAFFFSPMVSAAAVEIRRGGSSWAEIEDDGTIRINGNNVGKWEPDGTVRKASNFVGRIESNGTIRRGGNSIGTVEILCHQSAAKENPDVCNAVSIDSAAPSFAQIDRARGGGSDPAGDAPWGQFCKYYRETGQYADQNDRDAALRSLADMSNALNAVNDFTRDIPGRLNDKNLRDLANQAEQFLQALNNFKDRTSSLRDKLQRTGESYSSELSALRSAFDTMQSKFILLWDDFKTTGRDIAGKYEAIKATCMVRCLP